MRRPDALSLLVASSKRGAHSLDSQAFRVTAFAAALLVASGAGAQEAVLNGLGWVKQSAGSELDSSTRLQVNGNRATAGVTASGGKVGVAANVGGRLELISTAQANTAGLNAMAARNTQVQILQNQVSGLVNALGGAASGNTVLISGGAGRKSIADSRFTLNGNTAGSIYAIGAQGSVLLGAGSLQLPGRAAANTVLIDESELRRVQVTSTDNRTERTSAFGGAALANALTAAKSTLDDVQISQSLNTARDVRAGGGNASAGYGVVASTELTGAAAANSVVMASSQARGLRVNQMNNTAQGTSAVGGSALANSFSLSDYTGQLQQYNVAQSDNRARDVQAHGGDASVLGGVLADVSISATALANSVSIQGGQLSGVPQHTLKNNTAEGVRATGGGAAANSVWLQAARSESTPVTITGNIASRVETAGGAGNIGGGAVGSFERNSRALGNSVVADGASRLTNAPVTVHQNGSRDLRASGGTVVSASVLATGNSTLRGTQTTLSGNRAQTLRATGFEGSIGGGLLGTSSQQAIALANSLAAEGSTVSARNVNLTNNEAAVLRADGGKLLANSISVEKNGGGASQLGGDAVLTGNTARDITTGAGGMAGPGRVFSQERRARAAANSIALVDNAETDASSPVRVTGNVAGKVSAIGGTALVNALGAYRGARLSSSPVTLSGNDARDITVGGASGQVAGVGNVRNGILVANGAYLEAEGGARLAGTPVAVTGNTANRLQANGGRVTANSLAINGQGRVEGSGITITTNRATDVRSEGSEGTVLGHAVIDRGVGSAAANALQILGSLRGASVQLAGNTAERVFAKKGLAAVNSVIAEEDSNTESMQAAIRDNQSADVSASNGKTALASSINNLGRIEGGSVNITNNRASANAGSGDALAASLRNDKRGSITSSQITISANRASARDGGVASSVRNEGTLSGGRISILGNTGNADNNGVVNSLVNKGTLQGGSITILGNSGNASGGTLNSVINERAGQLTGARVLIAGNSGSASGGGLVNSVLNSGTLTGRVTVTGNNGSATGGGTVNSLVNQGRMTGTVLIAGNNGAAAAGGTANSVINRGVISGKVSILGSQSAGAAGMTAGSVRNLGGNIVGRAGVLGNVPFLANPGMNTVLPSTGVITRSVTVEPAGGTLHL
jgi:hypothetical protein